MVIEDVSAWVKVERVLGDRLEQLGLEVRWADTQYNYRFGGRDRAGKQRAYHDGTERSGPHTRAGSTCCSTTPASPIRS